MKTKIAISVFFLLSFLINAGNLHSSLQGLALDSNTHISAVASDEEHIWIGTNDGVYKINKKTKKGTHLTKDNSLLPSNYVTSICCRKNGNVWIGTSCGVLRYDNVTYVLVTTENSYLPDNHITSVVEDSEENLWIGTYFGGLAKLHNFHYTVFNQKNSSLASDCIFSLSADDCGNIWVAPSKSGLVKIHGKDWQVFNADNSGLSAANISFVLKQDNKYFIGSYNEGMFTYNGTSFTKIENPQTQVTNLRYAFNTDEKGKWVLGCDKGIYILQQLACGSTNRDFISYNNLPDFVNTISNENKKFVFAKL